MNICTTLLLISYGWTSHYAPNVMDMVIENRVEWGHIEPDISRFDGFVAVPSCDRIGDELLVRVYEWELMLVTDCAKEDDSDGAYSWMTENDILIEVDWETAMRWGAVGGGTRVEVADPVYSRVCPS